MRKEDSKDKTYFRSNDRVFHMNGGWWFATRDEDCGPYPSKTKAQAQLNDYLKQLRVDFDPTDTRAPDRDRYNKSVWDDRLDVR